MLSVVASRRARKASNSVRDTNTAVNTLDSRPKNSVVAKPRIGPGAELEQERRRDERGDVGVENREEHAVEAGGDRLPHALARAPVSSLMRSKISTFESTPMPIVRMKPAMPGSVIVASM